MVFRPKKYNFSEAMQRMRKYCAYQERCHQEVRRKLYDWGFDNEDIDKVSVQLMEEGFLNEERFAKALAGGKFRTKGWGKKKIEEQLKQKGVSSYLVKTSLQTEINPEQYRERLRALLEKKLHMLRTEKMPQMRKQKAARFAMTKGYEPELVWSVLGELLNNE